MGLAYSPDARTITTEYLVATTGDRFFIPASAPEATNAEQLAQCQALIGTGDSDAVVASERVAQ